MNANSSLTTSKWLKTATAQLLEAGIGTAELDALVLLEDCLQKGRAVLLAHPNIELSATQQNVLNSQIARRMHHEPLAYIREKTEFYGRTFFVNSDVLEPRPETEAMIEQLKKLKIPTNFILVDIGTGSGAIAITTQLELPHNKVIATDIDKTCLKIAEKNTTHHNTKVTLLEGNLLEPLTDQHIDVILANLPYVPRNFGINKAALHEPYHAIFGGEDGLDLYRELFAQIKARKQKSQFVFTEALPFQHHQLQSIAEAHNYALQTTDDFIQVFVKKS